VIRPATLEDLKAYLAQARARSRCEIDLYDEEGEEGPFFSTSVFTSKERAFLMYFGFEGDPAFSSYDPTYTGPPEATCDFQLSNGQIDVYPASWTVPIDDAFRALEYTFLYREPAPWVPWREGGD
jgi:hypothetical protein